MPKKKGDYKAYLKHQKFVDAGYIKERYPQVKALTFELNYRDPYGLAEPSQKVFTRGPEHSLLYLNLSVPITNVLMADTTWLNQSLICWIVINQNVLEQFLVKDGKTVGV